MSAQHTPGPWRLSAGSETTIFSFDGQRQIAEARCGGMSGIKSAEAEANARLMAAAPDLKAALLALIPSNVALGNQSWADGTIIPVEMTLGELRQARAAIAKAVGQ